MRFKNNEAAARAVYRYIRPDDDSNGLRTPLRYLVLRPFGGESSMRPHPAPKFAKRTAPLGNQSWWLVPTKTWPAHRHSKLFFRQRGMAHGKDMGLMFTGVCIEKGFDRRLSDTRMGPPLAKTYRVMDETWYWYNFLSDACGSVLDTPMRAILERTPGTLTVHLDLYDFNHLPDLETGEHSPDDQLTFAVHTADVETGRALSFEQTGEAYGILTPLNEATNMADLASRILTLREIGWYWINWRIGTCIRYGGGITPQDTAWGAKELWHNVLEPWLPWVR